MWRLLLAPIILQSVLIGGGYAKGKEIVEYGAKYGAMGSTKFMIIIVLLN